MKDTARNRLGLLILGIILIGGFLLLAFGCDKKPDLNTQLLTERDAYRDSLAVCRAQSRQQQAQLNYGQISRNPASAWSDDSLARFLTEYGVHPQSSRGPQRR